ncbi:zinc knuckle domain-containing protein [Histoplasma capsulatum G186AR]|uniref:Zinc knuckle domain-containing protein n=1 Tax=Ajellomyces capsulatus TaxID=5037 RepID=A0A8H8CYQ3_AJECA|nr:zinc knuckle domain-containing protein [Histoplasma capsulatum]QSS75049.1 zinc knuckle domain-containing protein [Histoplasma capsulatum G186AR]
MVTAVAIPVAEELLAARNATNVAKSDISPVTAPKAEVTDPVVTVVLLVVVTAVAMAVVASRLATRVVVTGIWLATALRVKSATIAVKLATSPETVPPKLRVSEFVTNANNPAMSKQLAPTKREKGVYWGREEEKSRRNWISFSFVFFYFHPSKRAGFLFCPPWPIVWKDNLVMTQK